MCPGRGGGCKKDYAHHPPVSKQRTDTIACGLTHLYSNHFEGSRLFVVEFKNGVAGTKLRFQEVRGEGV